MTDRNVEAVRTPKRIQMRRARGWRKPASAVYVGRPSRDGNRFRVGPYSAFDAVRMFREELELECARDPQAAEMTWARLRSHDLACWCRLCPAHADGLPLGVECAVCSPCHANVLLELANK